MKSNLSALDSAEWAGNGLNGEWGGSLKYDIVLIVLIVLIDEYSFQFH